MKQTNMIIVSALAGIIATGCATSSDAIAKAKTGKYRCEGIAVKGGNDCAARGHQCAGKAKKNFDPMEWMYAYNKAACKSIQSALTNGHVKDYVTAVQKKTIVHVKRNIKKI